MIENLNKKELEALLKTVFDLKPKDKSFGFFIDLPNNNAKDSADWADTRVITYEWFEALYKENDIGLKDVNLYCFENVGANNADLPKEVYKVSKPDKKLSIENLEKYGDKVLLESELKKMDAGLAPTYFSCTAPMKMLAKKCDFRAATMPGFKREMIPALGIDYSKVSERVTVYKEKMDRAIGFTLILNSKGKDYKSYFDLRFRTSHASTGLIREPKTAGNLPSGEAYIVPYEGEKENEPSKTIGILPVEIDGEIVEYKIENNRAISVKGDGPIAAKERDFLNSEPAYGNISEIGMGVLNGFGISASGSILLDEKLGLHIAFGRSEHFGGIVGPGSFKDPKNVVHTDRVYVKSLQPNIKIVEAKFLYEDGTEEKLNL